MLWRARSGRDFREAVDQAIRGGYPPGRAVRHGLRGLTRRSPARHAQRLVDRRHGRRRAYWGPWGCGPGGWGNQWWGPPAGDRRDRGPDRAAGPGRRVGRLRRPHRPGTDGARPGTAMAGPVRAWTAGRGRGLGRDRARPGTLASATPCPAGPASLGRVDGRRRAGGALRRRLAHRRHGHPPCVHRGGRRHRADAAGRLPGRDRPHRLEPQPALLAGVAGHRH